MTRVAQEEKMLSGRKRKRDEYEGTIRVQHPHPTTTQPKPADSQK
jgi:hypothetical protein